MKIALIQMAVEANLTANHEKIITYLKEALTKKAEIVCFPEMSLGGYDLKARDQKSRDAHDAVLTSIQAFAAEHGMTVLIGDLEVAEGQSYISQYVLNERVETYRKIHVGQRERTYVSPGEVIQTFQHKSLTFGIMLCYDGHFPELSQIMAGQGAKIIFNPSASPNNPGRRVSMWEKYLVSRAYDNRVWIAATNLRFNGKGGGMGVWNSDGHLVDDYREALDQCLIFDYEEKEYSRTSMKNRAFDVDRRQDIYDKYR